MVKIFPPVSDYTIITSTVPCSVQPPPASLRNPRLRRCKSLFAKFTRLPSDCRISAMTRDALRTLPSAQGTSSTQPMMLPRRRDSLSSVLSRRKKENTETHTIIVASRVAWERDYFHDIFNCIIIQQLFYGSEIDRCCNLLHQIHRHKKLVNYSFCTGLQRMTQRYFTYITCYLGNLKMLPIYLSLQ